MLPCIENYSWNGLQFFFCLPFVVSFIFVKYRQKVRFFFQIFSKKKILTKEEVTELWLFRYFKHKGWNGSWVIFHFFFSFFLKISTKRCFFIFFSKLWGEEHDKYLLSLFFIFFADFILPPLIFLELSKICFSALFIFIQNKKLDGHSRCVVLKI